MSIRLTKKEIDELPDELIRQLSIENHETEQGLIERLMSNNGGTATLDQLLVFIYKETGEVKKRHKLNAKMYRMEKKGIVKKVEGTRSFYNLVIR